MNPQRIRDTTLDPPTGRSNGSRWKIRRWPQRLVDPLMEDKNAEARRDFLAEHARKVAELDY